MNDQLIKHFCYIPLTDNEKVPFIWLDERERRGRPASLLQPRAHIWCVSCSPAAVPVLTAFCTFLSGTPFIPPAEAGLGCVLCLDVNHFTLKKSHYCTICLKIQRSCELSREIHIVRIVNWSKIKMYFRYIRVVFSSADLVTHPNYFFM